MYLIHLSYQTSHFHLTNLNVLPRLTLAYSWAKSSNTTNTWQSISCLSWRPVWLAEKCSSPRLASIPRGYPTAYCQPGKRSKFKIPSTVSTKCILLSHHHKVKNHKSNHLNNIPILSLTSHFSSVMLSKDIYAHVTGLNKGMHYTKAPVTFNTSVTAETILSDPVFLHQQDLASLIIVCLPHRLPLV